MSSFFLFIKTRINSSLFDITGSVVDVGKLLSQLKRSENARSDTERQLKSAQKSVQELKDASEKQSSAKDKLQVSPIFHSDLSWTSYLLSPIQ